MADLAGIRAALATQAGNASSVREATSTSLSNVGMLPAVKVERVESISINDARGGRGAGFESRIINVVGKLLVTSSSDTGRNQVRAEETVEELFTACRTGLRLGYGGIVEDSWLESAEVGTIDFGGTSYYGADLRWVVEIIEAVERTS